VPPRDPVTGGSAASFTVRCSYT